MSTKKRLMISHSDAFEGVKSFFLKLKSKASKTSNINTKAFSITKQKSLPKRKT